MLFVLMYHRVGTGKYSNSLDMLKKHFHYLSTTYPIVLPGDPLQRGSSICITFDDATYDFYHYVFPLLKELKIRVVLGVPSRYILKTTDVVDQERLAVPYTLAMQDGFFETKAPFCTWSELKEMVQSGLVEVASHAHAHCNLTFPFVDLDREIVQSKKIIEEHLLQPVTTFIYPFGRYNERAQDIVSKHYLYSFRIGSSGNWNWGMGKKPLCRISGDQLVSPSKILAMRKKIHYMWASFFT